MAIVLPDKQYGQLLPYKESIASTKTMATEQYEWKLWLEIPKDIAKDLTLEQVKELGLNPTEIDIETAIVRDSVRPWLVLNPLYIDQTPGFHMLQFIFRNQALNVYQSFYFSYLSQVDNPEKPYIYMKREEETS